MNMILYKSTHCPFLLHYPLSSHAVVTRTMKISRIYLLFDTRNLVWFLCSGWQVVVLYATPTRALMLVKKLQSWRVVAPFQGRWENFWKIVDLAIFESDIVSLCVESQISLLREFLEMWGLYLQQGFSFERKVYSLSELRCEHVSEEILISR